MKNILKMTSALAVVAGFAGVASADSGNPASDSATASVTVVQPITVDDEEPLRFGNLVVNGAGTATIDADAGGARTLSGPAIQNGPSGPFNAAEFTVDAGAYAWTATVTDNNMGGAIDLATSQSALGGNGDATIYVGGTLTFLGTETAGTYNGTVTLTAQYN